LLEIDVVVHPMADLGAFPLGGRRTIAFDGGTFEGRDGLRGTIAPGGVDWQIVRGDGVIEIDAHYLLVTDRDEPKSARPASARPVPRWRTGWHEATTSRRASTTSARTSGCRRRRLAWPS
jgi:hypothetical protein